MMEEERRALVVIDLVDHLQTTNEAAMQVLQRGHRAQDRYHYQWTWEASLLTILEAAGTNDLQKAIVTPLENLPQ